MLFCALARRERAGAADAAVLLTRDANLRVKAAACGVVSLPPHSLPRSRAALLRMCRNGGVPTAAPAPEPEPTCTDGAAGGGAVPDREQARGREAAREQAPGSPAAADAPAAMAVPVHPQAASELAWLQPRMPAPSQAAPAGAAAAGQGRQSGDAAQGAGMLERMSHLMLGSRASQESTGSPTAGLARDDGGGGGGGAAARGPEHAFPRGMGAGAGGEGGSMERLLRSLGSREGSGLGRAGSGHSDGGGDPWGALAQDALALLESGLSDTALFFFQKELGSMWTGVQARLSACIDLAT